MVRQLLAYMIIINLRERELGSPNLMTHIHTFFYSHCWFGEKNPQYFAWNYTSNEAMKYHEREMEPNNKHSTEIVYLAMKAIKLVQPRTIFSVVVLVWMLFNPRKRKEVI